MRRILGLLQASDDDVDAALRELLAPLLVHPRCPTAVLTLEQTLRLPQRAQRHYCLHAEWVEGAESDEQVMAGTITDVTNARLPAPPAELRDHYRLLVELSPDAIVVHCEGRVVFANQAAVDLMHGKAVSDLLGRPISDFVAPESQPGLAERIAQMKESDTHSEPAEVRLLRLDDTTVMVQSVSVRTQWDDKPAFQVIMRDLTNQKAAEVSLRLQAQLIEHVSDAIIGTDAGGRITSWNPAAAALYGWEASSVLGRPAGDVLGRGGADAGHVTLPRGAPVELIHRHRDDRALQLLVSVADIKDSTGGVSGAVMICSDVSQRRKAERIREAADARYSIAVAALDEGLLIIGADGVTETANPAAVKLLGCSAPVGMRFFEVATLLSEAEEPLSEAELGLEETRLTGVARPAVVAAVRRSSSALTFLDVSVRAIPNESGDGPFPVVMCLRDVTERYAAAEILRYEARHDHMTGLANRNHIMETLDELLASQDRTVGVLFIDLDRFKMVNDSLGHAVGDAVLRAIAARIEDRTDAKSTVGRLAGDEFVIVVPDATEAELEPIAADLLGLLCKPVRIAGRDIVVTCSIGAAVAANAMGNGPRTLVATDLIRNADVAMYYAKQHGRNRFATFDERFRRRAIDRLELEEDLRRGLERVELWPAYQPLVDLTTMRTVGFEALARWTHPQRGPIPPTVFIPIAEETGLIGSIGVLMLDQAMSQLAQWRETEGMGSLAMSVNLSPRQLADPQVAGQVKAVLERYALPAEALNLEITESALMDDPDLAVRTLTELRDLGVAVSIDDFGTGYSSLSYLRHLPATSVKIDRSFVERLDQAGADEAMVAGIINLSHTLGMSTCAEGVETQEQIDTLVRLGCNFAQGFAFSRPVRAAVMTSLLTSGKLLTATAKASA